MDTPIDAALDPKASRRTVFLLDVDNTLLDNDTVIQDLRETITSAAGPEREARYWTIFESCRAELGYALARKGMSVKTLDLLIAVHAIVHDAELLTGDSDFRNIAKAGVGLRLA